MTAPPDGESGPFPRISVDTPPTEAAVALGRIARVVRRWDIETVARGGQGHVGSDLSVIDLLVTLYFAVMRFDPRRPDWPERDRLVLSKGHASVALYATLAALGVLPRAELATFLEPRSRLGGHPDRNKCPGVEVSTGALGHGLPQAVGLALAARFDGSDRRTFVVVGDGELQEGSNWEALMAAAQFGLGRLTVIVDRNGLQQGASVAATNDLEPLAGKATAFGWAVTVTDGHDHAALFDVLRQTSGRPRFVIARTVKGHPVSFMADRVAWHHKVPDAAQAALALNELEAR
jgi:transketolase